MKNKNVSLINSIIFIILGIMLFAKPDVVVKFISYLVGGILIGVGLYRVVSYYIQDKRNQVVNYNELAFGITAIVLGIVFIFLASAIELLLRFIVGAWLIIAGLGKIMQTFYTTTRDNKFYTLIVMGVILIGIGLYIVLVSNLALSIIGLFMIIYGIIDIASIFVSKDFAKANTTIDEEPKEIATNEKIIEGEVEEVTLEEENKEETKKKTPKETKKDKPKKKKVNRKEK